MGYFINFYLLLSSKLSIFPKEPPCIQKMFPYFFQGGCLYNIDKRNLPILSNVYRYRVFFIKLHRFFARQLFGGVTFMKKNLLIGGCAALVLVALSAFGLWHTQGDASYHSHRHHRCDLRPVGCRSPQRQAEKKEGKKLFRSKIQKCRR